MCRVQGRLQFLFASLSQQLPFKKIMECVNIQKIGGIVQR